jgi:hypothetical protein
VKALTATSGAYYVPFTITFTVLPGVPPISGGGVASVDCSITITGSSSPDTPTIECAGPPDGNEGEPYSHQFGVSGGTVTLLSGALPPGLSVNSAGLVTGTPTAPGIFVFTLKTT